jgi:serine phosphatase RsbU (regulator of sigma subunit)
VPHTEQGRHRGEDRKTRKLKMQRGETQRRETDGETEGRQRERDRGGEKSRRKILEYDKEKQGE